MTVFLNVLFMAVSVMYLMGRLYEINVIMDRRTGFVLGTGVVTTPIMMAIVCVIAACCGIIMFSPYRQNKKMKTMPVGILGVMAGVFFTAGGIVNSLNCFKYGGFILYHGMEALGGIGIALLGAMNIKGENREKVPVVLTLFIPVGTCMNSVLHEIKTIRDTGYLMRSLAGLFTLIFLTLLFKTAYAPNKTSKMLLYIFSLVNFVFTGMGSLAAVLGDIMTGMVNLPQLLYNVGYIFIGIYSVFIAFFISPSKIEYGEAESTRPAPKKPAKKKTAVSENKEELPRYNFGQTGNINQAAIDELFARKDMKEKQREYVSPVQKSKHQEKAAPIYAQPKLYEDEPASEKTAVMKVSKEKSAFKGDGKKSQTKKIVYKAPK